jgi:hypothetical protein
MATQFNHKYKEFSEEAIRKRIQQMLAFRDEVDVENAHVKFSYDNRKTGALVPSVSLIPVADCPNCSCCKNGCYDIRNVCFQKTVQKSRAINSAIAHGDPDKFFREVSGRMRALRYIRIFVGGDIINYGFFEGMVKCAQENPHCEMLAFTKAYAIPARWIDMNGELPVNLHIILSEWRGAKVYNPHNLPTSTPVWPGDEKKDGIWCTGDCSACAEAGGGCWGLKKGERVLFEAH